MCDIDVGGDLTAFTGDDVISECRRYVALAGEQRTLTSIGPGTDGDWLTDDDELGGDYARALLDGAGAVIRRETHAVADDGTATPSADTLIAYTEIDRDANHPIVEWRSYLADDTAVERAVYTVDGDGFVRTEDVYEAGEDGSHGTPDDFHFSRMAWFWL
ncbi:MAG TPA: hypothetical protein VMZ28_30750 [Kofleriaceae bacterium]|nr:hypothetical protein [Kofleriaceae bacterium]